MKAHTSTSIAYAHDMKGIAHYMMYICSARLQLHVRWHGHIATLENMPTPLFEEQLFITYGHDYSYLP